MRVTIRAALAAVGLLAACRDGLAPSSEPSLMQVGAGKPSQGLACPGISGEYVYATDVNPAGTIVGYLTRYDEGYAFVCDNKHGTTVLFGGLISAAAINAAGQVVGVGGEGHAYLREKGVLTDLGALAGEEYSLATAINDAGQVVGYSGNHAFLWRRGVMVDLGTLPGASWSRAEGINTAGQVVGTSGTNHTVDDRAFLWRNGRMVDLGTLGGAQSYAAGINAAGQIIGGAQTASGEWHAAVWHNGTITDLGPGKGGAINNAGVAVGTSGYAAVFWRKGVMTTLESPEEESQYFVATGINPSGLVVGYEIGEYYGLPRVWTIR